MTVDELRTCIEHHLDQMSDEAERLRAALAALGPVGTPPASIETSRSRGARPRRTVLRGATQHTVREARVAGRERTTSASDGTAFRRPTTVATPSHGLFDRRRTAEDAGTSPRSREETAPTKGADRALQELRSELTAGLRTSRSE